MAKIFPIVLIGGVIALAMSAAKGRKEEAEGAVIPLDPEIVPKIKANQIAFSANFESYKIGAQWRTVVLDAYLNDARLAGELAYEDWRAATRDAPHPWLDEMREKFGNTWHMDMADKTAITVYWGVVLARTRMEVLQRFYDSHYAVIPGAAAPLSALPKTAATDEFYEIVSEYAAKFQRSKFPTEE